MLPVGVSADGSTVVLVEDGVAVEALAEPVRGPAPGDDARIVELAGSFEFDALSPDGSILYVVEHLAGPPEGHYQVRAVDVATGVMRDAVIVDKRNLDEAMAGWPITQLRHDNGVVFTLYRGAEHPFIHALNTQEAWAICLDLPSRRIRRPGGRARLGSRPGGRRPLRVRGQCHPRPGRRDRPGRALRITRAASFRPRPAAATIALAKFGHQEGGPVGRRAVASPDGSTALRRREPVASSGSTRRAWRSAGTSSTAPPSTPSR